MTIVHCLMTAASLEGGLRCGLIQSNTGYEELLRVTSLAVQLVDRQGNGTAAPRTAAWWTAGSCRPP